MKEKLKSLVSNLDAFLRGAQPGKTLRDEHYAIVTSVRGKLEDVASTAPEPAPADPKPPAAKPPAKAKEEPPPAPPPKDAPPPTPQGEPPKMKKFWGIEID